MFWTRQDNGFRGWLQAVRTNGTLRTGLSNTDFDVNVVNNMDTTSIVPFVSESVQKSGLYYFDIPTYFLLSGGLGEYGVSIEIDATSPPKVTSASSEVLKINQDDFDSLSGSLPSVDTIVSGVWNATDQTFNTSGTMGYLQNLIDDISGNLSNLNVSIDVPTIVSGVWNANSSSFNNALTMGALVHVAAGGSVTASVDVPSIVAGVWNALTSSYNLSGTMGGAQGFSAAFAGGRWIISGTQHVFFGEDNTTEIARFDLFDQDGNPSDVTDPSNPPFERVRVTGSA